MVLGLTYITFYDIFMLFYIPFFRFIVLASFLFFWVKGFFNYLYWSVFPLLWIPLSNDALGINL